MIYWWTKSNCRFLNMIRTGCCDKTSECKENAGWHRIETENRVNYGFFVGILEFSSGKSWKWPLAWARNLQCPLDDPRCQINFLSLGSVFNVRCGSYFELIAKQPAIKRNNSPKVKIETAECRPSKHRWPLSIRDDRFCSIRWISSNNEGCSDDALFDWMLAPESDDVRILNIRLTYSTITRFLHGLIPSLRDYQPPSEFCFETNMLASHQLN